MLVFRSSLPLKSTQKQAYQLMISTARRANMTKTVALRLPRDPAPPNSASSRLPIDPRHLCYITATSYHITDIPKRPNTMLYVLDTTEVLETSATCRWERNLVETGTARMKAFPRCSGSNWTYGQREVAQREHKAIVRRCQVSSVYTLGNVTNGDICD